VVQYLDFPSKDRETSIIQSSSKMVRGNYVLNELNGKLEYCGGENSIVWETSKWGYVSRKTNDIDVTCEL